MKSLTQVLILASLSLCIGGSPCFAAPTAVENITSEIKAKRQKVEEFRVLKKKADALGVRVWLFGGTASGLAHYVRQDLQRRAGDTRYIYDRYDYSFPNIYHSMQDIDLVVDGTPDQAQKLQYELQKQFPYFMGSKSSWEIRLLRQNMGDKLPLLNDYDFLNQHTDSNSTGLIEITDSADPIIKDLRDWNSTAPRFLKDIKTESITFYFSENHQYTKRAKDGVNPPIIAAIRYLTKLLQFRLSPRPSDLEKVSKIIADFDPKSVAASPDYVGKWLEKNVPKLIQFAADVEYAVELLDKMGVRKKMALVHDNQRNVGSMAWWMGKEPLRSFKIGKGKGKTLREILIENQQSPEDAIFSHETNSYLSYEGIKRSPLSEPNVLISRDDYPGEAALNGWGHYTLHGRLGARGTGYTVRYKPDLDARYGTDFVGDFPTLIFRNRNALKVIPEQLNMTLMQFVDVLSKGEIRAEDKGILERLRRQVQSQVATLKPAELKSLSEKATELFNQFLLGESSSSPANLLVELIRILPNSEIQKLIDLPDLAIEDLLDKVYGKNKSGRAKDSTVYDLVDQLLKSYNATSKRPINLEQIFAAAYAAVLADPFNDEAPNMLSHFVGLPGSSKYWDRIGTLISCRGWGSGFGNIRIKGFLDAALKNKEWHPYIGKALMQIGPALKAETLTPQQTASFVQALRGSQNDPVAALERTKQSAVGHDANHVASILEEAGLNGIFSFPEEVVEGIFEFVFSSGKISWSTVDKITTSLATMKKLKIAQVLAKYHKQPIQSPGSVETVSKFMVQNLIFSEAYANLSLWKTIPLQSHGREIVIGLRALKNWKDRAAADKLYLEMLDLINGSQGKDRRIHVEPGLLVELISGAPASDAKNAASVKEFQNLDLNRKAHYLADDVPPQLLSTFFKTMLSGPGAKDGSDSVSFYPREKFDKFMKNFWEAIRKDPSVAEVGALNWKKITSSPMSGLSLFPFQDMVASRDYIEEKKLFLKHILQNDAFSKMARSDSDLWSLYGIVLAPWYLRDQELVKEARAAIKRANKQDSNPFLVNLYLTLGRELRGGKRGTDSAMRCSDLSLSSSGQ